MNVSVLISNYNYGRYLEAAVESVMRQSLAAVEVVIVDDGSLDDSRERIERLAERYPGTVIPVFQANAGQAAAINAGFARASGDVICLLDADDLWDPSKLQEVAAVFAGQPTLAMVMHQYRLVDADGNPVAERALHELPNGDLGPLMVKTGGMWVFGATSSLSLSRAALQQILPIPAGQWRLCADGAIAYAATFLGPVRSLERPLGSYRLHGKNNHFAAGIKDEKTLADVEMTNVYLNEFLARLGRPERLRLADNLSYRRNRFYVRGGSPGEALAIAGLILRWPLYPNFRTRLHFLARFAARAMRPRRAMPSCPMADTSGS